MKWLLATCIMLFVTSWAFASVDSEIRAKAAREWPRDYNMQKFVIDQQHEALDKLRTMRTPAGMPADVYKNIREDAVNRWPGDYVMQVFVINQQVEAWRSLNR